MWMNITLIITTIYSISLMGQYFFSTIKMFTPNRTLVATKETAGRSFVPSVSFICSGLRIESSKLFELFGLCRLFKLSKLCKSHQMYLFDTALFYYYIGRTVAYQDNALYDPDAAAAATPLTFLRSLRNQVSKHRYLFLFVLKHR